MKHRTLTLRQQHRAEQVAYFNMKNRCYNPKDYSYHNYGGRGITVSPEWKASFERFFADVGPKPTAYHSLGRLDNSLGYFAGNVKWQTGRQQSMNRRKRTPSRILVANGCSLGISEWSRILGVHLTAINVWLKRNTSGTFQNYFDMKAKHNPALLNLFPIQA